MEEFRPPLPQSVLSVLQRASLLYLATAEDGDPHLSLMNFATIEDAGDIAIVFSTQRKTKKFEAIQKNPKVAILIHDFDGIRRDSGGHADEPLSDHFKLGTCSVTVYGRVEQPEGVLLDRCRDAHMRVNHKYRHFIEGPDVAILLVRPSLARICSVDDKVCTWAAPAVAAAAAAPVAAAAVLVAIEQ